MSRREAEEKIRSLALGFPAVAVIGPRQSGKTTLVRAVFPELPYVLLEDPDTRAFAEEDPRSFFAHYEKTGAVSSMRCRGSGNSSRTSRASLIETGGRDSSFSPGPRTS